MQSLYRTISLVAIVTLSQTFAPAAGPAIPDLPGDVEVFKVIEGRDRQIYFESNAPLEDIKGQSNAVSGYTLVGDDGNVISGEWWVPVTSLQTGIALRDEHLHGRDWLDAEAHPDIKVRLTEVTNWTEVDSTDAFRKFEAKFIGEVEIHGQTQPVESTATVIVLNESDRTRKIAPGDLLAIQTSFTVKLADYGISHPVIGEKVANTVEIDVALYHSNG